ncbi:MAG: hypothetical protein JNJ56_11025 [Ignavibacteria bacterium]|nr:hypothetical protein [Ignavibacteria bacterium]
MNSGMINLMKYLAALLFLTFHAGISEAQYSSPADNIYVGFGTALSSYAGGYFGNAYQMRVLSGYDDDYYDYYDYNEYYYEDDYTIWSPLEVDAVLGFRLEENLSLEFASSFLFHPNGRVDPQYEYGNIGEKNYVDRNSVSSLYAVPLSASLKLHSSGYSSDGVYLKIGAAVQYTSEEYDRYRKVYFYDNEYYYNVYYQYLGTFAESKWLPGFTGSIGAQFSLSDYMSAYTELDYSYFKINGNNSNALALERASYAQLFSFKTVVYVSF